jgi:DNA-directed RNA polymerase sigma subunit (sigma70/sigma32)
MMAFAQSIDAQFRASQRALRQAALRHGSVCQMPRVDVEMQTIERLEELVRMPCEMFLRNYFLSNMAAWSFRQARRDLIEDHLHLVASIAVTYSNRGLPLPRLVREGIAGLIRAVEKFGNRLQWSFSTYAACWIRQNIRAALAAQASPRRGGPASGGSRRPHERGHPAGETILGRPVI